MNQHEFKDVMAHIAEVASEAKGKLSIYDRSKTINNNGQISASDIGGSIDSSMTGITNGTSTKFTDGKGNDVWSSPDGMSAMSMNSGVFRIANSKDLSGNWIWREFGSGNGFNAREILYGEMSGERIADGTLRLSKLSPNYLSELLPTIATGLFEDLFASGIKLPGDKIMQIRLTEFSGTSSEVTISPPAFGYDLARVYVIPNNNSVFVFPYWENNNVLTLTVREDPGMLINYICILIWT